MRRLWLTTLSLGWLLGSCTCVHNNPVGPSGSPAAGLNNGTSYGGIVESPSNDVLFSPSGAGQNATSGPYFGGPIMYSWGGASTTVIQASQPGAVHATGAGSATALGFAPPTSNIWLLSGYGPGGSQTGYPNGIGGIHGDFGAANNDDYYVRWTGQKGPDPSLDYSSMTMYFFGNQIDYNLAVHHYRGFVFYARGHGNFEVSLSGNNTGDPYQGYNFYAYNFGANISDGQWHQITVLFTDMQQLYGQAVDINHVMTKCWGLQFDQYTPLVPNFQLDIDYVRFF